MSYSINSYIKLGEEFVLLADVNPPLDDPRYVEGAIVWAIDNETLISQTHWDSVDELWAYIVNGLGELNAAGTYFTYFPDQPLALAFKRLAQDRVEVTVGDTRHIVSASEFFDSIVEGGRDFFSRMLVLVPDGAAAWQRYLDELLRYS